MVNAPRPSSAVIALSIIASLSNVVNAMRLEILERRAAQTNAVCSPEYAWADNSKQTSPCMVAAQVLAACNGGSFRVEALIAANQSYTNPGGANQVANACFCSWAAYNLLSACSDCQGLPQAVKNYGDYNSGCTEFPSTRFFPAGYLPDSVLIPAWATTDPTQWADRRYSSAQARAIAQQGRPDVGEAQLTKPKKSSVGAIVGGVIGGLAAICLAAGIAYYMLRKHRQEVSKGHLVEKQYRHNRGPSDATMTSLGYTNTTSPSPGPGPSHANAPTIRTHTTSLNNFSVFGSPNNNTLYTTSPSPPPVTQPVPLLNPEDFIAPFSLQQHQLTNSSTSLSARDRKHPNGPITIYDSPNAPPTMSGDALFETPSERTRVNPPAYSPHPGSSNASGSGSQQPLLARPRTLHAANASDGDLSYASYNTSGLNQANDAARSSASDIYTSAPLDAQSAFGGTVQQTTYTSPSSYPRDVKRRPTEDSINPSNLG